MAKRGRDQEESKFLEVPTSEPNVPQGTHSHVRTVDGGAVAGELADGSAVLSSETTLRVDEDSGDATFTYIGRALITSAESASVWQIKRLRCQTPTNVEILWADGDTSFDNDYSNREALSYS